MQSMKMSQLKGIALVSLAMLVAAPAFSQTVSFYTGTLAIVAGTKGLAFAQAGTPLFAKSSPPFWG